MRGLKILIAVMSVLIVIGLGLFGYGMMRVYKKNAAPAAVSGMTAAPVILDTVAIPPNATIQSIAQYKDILAIAVTSPKGGDIYFYDPAKRAVTHILPLNNGRKK